MPNIVRACHTLVSASVQSNAPLVLKKMSYKKPYYISLIYLIVLFIGSFVFYKERMLFIDPAFITFEIINNKTFIIGQSRYGAFVTQMFPLLSVYFGAPLRVILILYSISFYLFFLIVAYISGRILKQEVLAILFVFYLCFLVSDVYFWPNNEIHQSVAWMILFLSLYNYSIEENRNGNKLFHIILIPLLFLSLITHLLILIPLTFLWFYNFMDRQSAHGFGNKRPFYCFLFYTLLLLIFAGLRLYLSYDSWYDGVKLEGVKNVTFANIVKALSNDQSISIFKLLFTKYLLLIIVFFIGMLTILKRKKLSLALLTISFTIGYYMLVVLTYSEKITDLNLFYFESQWMGLSLIVCTPFLFETMKYIKKSNIALALFVLIYLLKIPHLSTSLEKFKMRLTHLEANVEEAKSQQIQKGILIDSDDLKEKFLVNWGVPIESTLLSSLNSKKAPTTIKIINSGSHYSTSTDSFYTAFEFVPISKLNSKYFEFSNETRYEVLRDGNR